jgi:hypothetical protein
MTDKAGEDSRLKTQDSRERISDFLQVTGCRSSQTTLKLFITDPENNPPIHHHVFAHFLR